MQASLCPHLNAAFAFSHFIDIYRGAVGESDFDKAVKALLEDKEAGKLNED